MCSDRFDSSERRERRIAIGFGAALLIAAALFVSFVTLPVWARWMAGRQVDIGAISEAQQWLRWAAWSAFSPGETELMRSACFRRLGQMDRWQAALESARAEGADSSRLEQEQTLGLIRMGAREVPEEYWKNPAGSGLRPYDAIEVCVRGHLVRNERGKAEQILAYWAAARPQDPQVAYLQGVYWLNRGDEAKALEEFENAVDRGSAHELAHTAVARLLEKQDRLTEALAAYVRFASDCPHSSIAVIGLAEVLRKLGHVEEARGIAEVLNSSSEPIPEVLVEMGSNDLESGNYQEALRWYGQATVAPGKKRRELQGDAATAFALEEEPAVANVFFEQADAEQAAEFRISELLTQLAVAPARQDAAEELKRLSAAAAEAPPQSTRIELERSRVARRDNAKLTGADLYGLYCTACHGADGDGNGRAARHQFPRPRDFCTESFRLVSTENGNPTVDDLKAVLKLGMPGTSMRAFDRLSDKQLELLSEEVLRMRRQGVRDWYVALLQAEEEEIDEQDVQEVVDLSSVPGDIIPLPAIGPADPAAVARGRKVYLDTGCRPCHGDDGTGPSELALFDEKGRSAWARDLANDPFKGGHEPNSICLRILAGMPGTPHPATKALTDEQYADLVRYCVSLSREPKRTLTNHERFLEATQRPLPSAITETNAGMMATGGDSHQP